MACDCAFPGGCRAGDLPAEQTGTGYGLGRACDPRDTSDIQPGQGLRARHRVRVDIFNGVGFLPKLLLDPSDLIALPALLVARFIWKRPSIRTTNVVLRGGALALAAQALEGPGEIHLCHGEPILT